MTIQQSVFCAVVNVIHWFWYKRKLEGRFVSFMTTFFQLHPELTGKFRAAVTYSEGLVLAKDDTELADRILDTRELFGIQDLGLTHQASTAEGEVFLIFLG